MQKELADSKESLEASIKELKKNTEEEIDKLNQSIMDLKKVTHENLSNRVNELTD